MVLIYDPMWCLCYVTVLRRFTTHTVWSVIDMGLIITYVNREWVNKFQSYLGYVFVRLICLVHKCSSRSDMLISSNQVKNALTILCLVSAYVGTARCLCGRNHLPHTTTLNTRLLPFAASSLRFLRRYYLRLEL